MNRIKRIWILGLLLIGASCNSWLDVAPEDQIMEKDLFEEREGFLMALNGVYLNMNSSSNYGGNLSAGIIDVMAQYYNCTTSEHNYSGYQSYAYDSKTSKDRFETVWKTTYSQISNLNAILEHCGDGNPVLPELYYKLIKGEALGLLTFRYAPAVRATLDGKGAGKYTLPDFFGTDCRTFVKRRQRIKLCAYRFDKSC